MSKFITEKQTEEYLEFSSRLLTMPDGSNRSVSAMKLIWDHYDFILTRPFFSEKKVMLYSQNMSEVENIDFNEAFEHMVSYIGVELTRPL